MNNKVIIDKKAIGQRIRDERQKLGLSREEFAEILGLSDYYVGQLERGERQMSLPVLVKIRNCLHVSLDYLVFGKAINDIYYIHDSPNMFDVYDNKYLQYLQIHNLLGRCSPMELELIIKLIKTILPYLNKS